MTDRKILISHRRRTWPSLRFEETFFFFFNLTAFLEVEYKVSSTIYQYVFKVNISSGFKPHGGLMYFQKDRISEHHS